MNLILLSDSDFINPNRVRLTGRRFIHMQDILKVRQDQSLTVGKINGLVGTGTMVNKESDALELEVCLDQTPPQALALTLILALPRPPMFKRILFSAAMLGVKRIIVLNFNRVEKSLWNSSTLKAPAISEQLILGLEQSKDTMMPQVILKKGFKPFVEDELPALIKGKLALVAHPDPSSGGRWERGIPSERRLLVPRTPRAVATAKQSNRDIWTGPDDQQDDQPDDKHILLVIGPEGGIIDYEIELLKKAGCQIMDLGPRILRTDSVLPYVVGRLF